LAWNLIQLRLENLYSTHTDMNLTSTVNMTQVAEAYYAIGNPTIVPYSYEIKEKSLSGNMDI